jgi:hypothetical protein
MKSFIPKNSSWHCSWRVAGCFLGLGLVLAACPGMAARLAMSWPDSPQQVFGGGARTLRVLVANASTQGIEMPCHIKLVQTSAYTAAGLAEQKWKTLSVASGQTLLETLAVEFPEVKAPVRFIVQLCDDKKVVHGWLEVLVYPQDLLAQLKALTGNQPIGIYDPTGQLFQLVKQLQVDYVDLSETGWDRFTGRLVVIIGMMSHRSGNDAIGNRIRALAKRGVGVVWYQSAPFDPLRPQADFFLVRVETGMVVVARNELAHGLEEKPESQVTLLHLARLATQTETLNLP